MQKRQGRATRLNPASRPRPLHLHLLRDISRSWCARAATGSDFDGPPTPPPPRAHTLLHPLRSHGPPTRRRCGAGDVYVWGGGARRGRCVGGGLGRAARVMRILGAAARRGGAGDAGARGSRVRRLHERPVGPVPDPLPRLHLLQAPSARMHASSPSLPPSLLPPALSPLSRSLSLSSFRSAATTTTTPGAALYHALFGAHLQGALV